MWLLLLISNILVHVLLLLPILVPWHVIIILLLHLLIVHNLPVALLNALALLIGASPRDGCKSMHLQTSVGLLGLVHGTHHEFVDLPIDDEVLVSRVVGVSLVITLVVMQTLGLHGSCLLLRRLGSVCGKWMMSVV